MELLSPAALGLGETPGYAGQGLLCKPGATVEISPRKPGSSIFSTQAESTGTEKRSSHQLRRAADTQGFLPDRWQEGEERGGGGRTGTSSSRESQIGKLPAQPGAPLGKNTQRAAASSAEGPVAGAQADARRLAACPTLSHELTLLRRASPRFQTLPSAVLLHLLAASASPCQLQHP